MLGKLSRARSMTFYSRKGFGLLTIKLYDLIAEFEKIHCQCITILYYEHVTKILTQSDSFVFPDRWKLFAETKELSFIS